MRVGPALVAWIPAARGEALTSTFDLLSESDLERSAGFTPEHLNHFLLGRHLIHALVADLFPEVTEWSMASAPCQRCGNRHAGVQLEGVPARASVAYAAGLVAAAVAPDARVQGLGIDLELDAADPSRCEELRRRLGASTERVLKRWTRVQAVLKADGRGLLIDPGAVRLRQGGAYIAGQRASYVVAEVPGPEGYLLSLAWSATMAGPLHPEQANRRTIGPAGPRWQQPSRPAPARMPNPHPPDRGDLDGY
ncbi:MAG: hypothetical protein IT193_13320 [Propionibacteriaceae bacterium]|nr:hypothetical protein [Propionibacteriaceae bacterium]